MNNLEALQMVLLLGTDRGPLSDELLDYLEKAGLTIATVPEKTVAEALVFHRQWQRAGFDLPVWMKGLPQLPLQQFDRECSSEAARCLQDILEGKYPEALREWVKLLLQAGEVLPRQALPALFQQCLKDTELWETIQPAIGTRGEWLMNQHPEWRQLHESLLNPQAWSTTTGPQRPILLRNIRKQDAVNGRKLLVSTWDEEDPAQKAQLLASLSIGLHSEDEAFLESCLLERRKEVRQIAAELLASIPNSALLARYQTYLQSCVEINKQILKLTLPLEAPEAWRKDGVEISGKAPFSYHQREAWLFQLIRRLPPQSWQTAWGLSPQEAIALFAQQDREESWVQALTDACLLHNDSIWQEALAEWWINNENSSSWKTTVGRHLLQQLPEAAFQKLLTPFLQNQPYLLEEDHVATFILCASGQPWNDQLALTLIQPFKRYLSGGSNPIWNIWHYARLLKAMAYHCDPALIAQFNSNWPYEGALWQRWQAEVERALNIIEFRGKMIRAFSPVG